MPNPGRSCNLVLFKVAPIFLSPIAPYRPPHAELQVFPELIVRHLLQDRSVGPYPGLITALTNKMGPPVLPVLFETLLPDRRDQFDPLFISEEKDRVAVRVEAGLVDVMGVFPAAGGTD